MNLQRYQLLKTKLDKIQREVDRSEGALEQTINTLKKEFGCDTLEQAQEKQQQIQAKMRKAEKRFDGLLESFEEKWGETLDLDGM